MPQPMQQGAKSVNKNLRKQPDNKGLQQASDRIDDNRERFRDKHSDRTSTADRVEIEKVAKPERPERPDKTDRPERPERAERPDAQLIADRPGNSDFGRSHRR